MAGAQTELVAVMSSPRIRTLNLSRQIPSWRVVVVFGMWARVVANAISLRLAGHVALR